MSGKRETQVVSGGSGTSGFSPSHLHLTRRAVLLAVLAVLLVAALFGYHYYQGHKQQPVQKSTQKAAAKTRIKPITVDYVQMDDAQLTSKVDYLIGTQQYAEADKLISMQSDLATNQVKLSLLVNIQQLEGKKTEAAATAEKIAALSNLGPGQYEQIGRQYAAAGNKSKAIEYFNKAIDAYNARHQGSYQADVARVQAEIKELQ